MPFYSHVFLQRPEINGYSEPHSKWTNQNLMVMAEIIDYNSLYKDIPYFFLDQMPMLLIPTQEDNIQIDM